MNNFNTSIKMITLVAEALGDELLTKVAFVGGCTTGLLVTDEISKESIRYTNDVDLIINVIGKVNWDKFQASLRKKGFGHSLVEDGPICRMKLGDLKVDFMPVDNSIGFTNKWYAKAFEAATKYALNDRITILLLTAPFFVATKIEAYLDRGNNDPLGSHDLEDILTLFDGREEIIEEIRSQNDNIQKYITDELKKILTHRDFEYLVQSVTKGDIAREKIIFERIRKTIKDMDSQK